MKFDRDLLARCLHRDDFAGLRTLIDSLKADPTAPAILERLAGDREVEVRSWAAGVAEETVGKAALPWLLKMARSDHDAENRSMALQEILHIDPEAVRPMIPHLRSLLRKKDPDYATDAAKALILIGDKESLPAMREVVESWEPGIYYRKRLEAWMLALEGRAEVIFARIREHDHICMGWLAYGASAFVRTPEARAVLEWGAENLPDEDCKRRCALYLKEGRWLPRENVPLPPDLASVLGPDVGAGHWSRGMLFELAVTVERVRLSVARLEASRTRRRRQQSVTGHPSIRGLTASSTECGRPARRRGQCAGAPRVGRAIRSEQEDIQPPPGRARGPSRRLRPDPGTTSTDRGHRQVACPPGGHIGPMLPGRRLA